MPNKLPKLYLAGKISGDVDAAFKRFMDAAHELRMLGYEVVNPVEINHDRPDWNTCMRRDIKALMECDAICLLPDWIESKGARIERSLAIELGMMAVLYESVMEMGAAGLTHSNSGDLIAAMFRDGAGA